MSVATVKAYVTGILTKLGLDNRVQVALKVHDAEPDASPNESARRSDHHLPCRKTMSMLSVMENNSAASTGHSASADYSAETALHDVADARERSAARVVTPWWYHPALGVALALVLVGVAIAPPEFIMVWTLTSIAITVSLILLYRRITGIGVGPAQAGPRSRLVWIAFVFLEFAGFGAAGVIRFSGQSPWLAALLGLAMILGTVILGRRVDDALRADIRVGDTYPVR